ncbi:MAG TPA: M14 family zinc carboxypeptidase [Candidatus Krumholzibacteria bacterium]
MIGRFALVRTLLLAGLVCAVAASVASAASDRQLVTVPFKGPRQIEEMKARGIEIIAYTKDGIDVLADPAGVSWLTTRSYQVAVRGPEAAPEPGAAIIDANLGLYHTYDETEFALGALVATYPSLADTIRIGKAYGPTFRNVTAIKISDNVGVDENEPEVLYMGNHHARELMSVEIPLRFAEYLLANYGTNSTVTNYVNTREIYLIPVVNPDGLAYVQANHAGSATTWWRKNRRNNGNGTFGVDLNRNYSYQWGYDNIGSSSNTASDVYRGPSAFSEPETQAIRNFCAARHFTCFLSYHSYGELLLYPWGYIAGFTPDQKVFAALGAALGAGTNYAVGNAALGTIYITNGDSDDWAYGEIVQKNRIFGFTPEVNNTGQGGFAPAETYIQPTFDLLLNMNLTLLQYADNPYRVIGPESPQQYVVQAPYANGINRISWTGNIPSDPNPVVSYQVEACFNPGLATDTCTPSLTGWTTGGWSYTASGFSGGGYNAGNGNSITHALQMNRPIVVDASTDTLRFKITYSLESNYDYGYVDVSTDGGVIWNTVPGNITTTNDPFGLNRGFGWTGASVGFVDAVFPLTGYLGQEIQLRIAYVTDGAVNGTGMTVDNIYPLLTCQTLGTVASAVVDTVYDHVPTSAGLWRYRVRAQDAEGQFSEWSNQRDRYVVTLTASDTPRRFETRIGANYPNPFNPTTQIPFTVGGAAGSRAVKTDLAIYDVTGAHVATLVNEARAPGTYVSRWSGIDDDGRPVASGVYFARLRVEGAEPRVTRLVLLK